MLTLLFRCLIVSGPLFSSSPLLDVLLRNLFAAPRESRLISPGFCPEASPTGRGRVRAESGGAELCLLGPSGVIVGEFLGEDLEEGGPSLCEGSDLLDDLGLWITHIAELVVAG